MSNEPTECINGRWYITMGQNGFNSPANNRMGYDTDAKARAAIARYTAKGEAHQAKIAAQGGY